MNYDADKSDRIMAQLKMDLANGRLKPAMQLLRHAEAGGGVRGGGAMIKDLRAAVGEAPVADLVRAFAEEACPYCRAGREQCEDCGGQGYYDDTRICRSCAGLGLQRCPFCNGTSFAGYDFVPKGLRPAAMNHRLHFAKEQIAELGRPGTPRHAGARDIARRILSLDRCRGILANAVEQVRLSKTGAPGAGYSAAERTKIEKECRRDNGVAEAAIRRLLVSLGEHFARKAERPNQDADSRALLAHRAKAFAGLGRGTDFGDSVLRTPAALK